MNKHTKLAFILAPILLVGGYIASDLYVEHQASQAKVFHLDVQGNCDVKANSCVLQSGEFMLGVSDKQGFTQVNSTFPLDTITLFLVSEQNVAVAHPLGMKHSAYYWQAKTPLGRAIAEAGSSYRLRLIAKIKGGAYISEFVTTTQ